MYRLSSLLPSSRTIFSNQLSSTTEKNAIICCRVMQACIQCVGKRRESLQSPSTCIRTLHQHHAPRMQTSIGLPGLHQRLPHPCHWSTHKHFVLLQNGTLNCSQSPPFRSLGISVTGSEAQGFYIPTPTEKCYELLEYIHDSAGLPWWLTILATTILFRGVIVFPFAIWQQKVFAKIENAQPIINTYVEHIKQQLAIIAKEKAWSQRQMAKAFHHEVRMLVSNVHFRNNCNPYKLAYLPFWQVGVWLSMTLALGQMTGMHPALFSTELDVDVIPALASEGALWFSDLMQTDMALAAMLGLLNITLVELWSLRRGPLTRTQHYLHIVFRVMAVGSIPVAAMMPSAVSFYWSISSLLGIGQLALLRIPSVRRAVYIQHAPSEMKRPVQEMRAGLKARYARKAF